MYNNEREIANKAERMLESALRSKVHSLSLHLGNDDNKSSMADATAESNFTRRKGWNMKKFSRLSITMEKHGFIQHHGIKAGTARSSGKRESSTGKSYNFKSQVYKQGMDAQDYIADAVLSSGVVDFVTTEVAELRGHQILLQMRFIENN